MATSRTRIARRPSLRSTVSRTSRSSGARAINRTSSRVSVMGRPSRATTMSPARTPAWAAGVSVITSTITTPKPSRMP